MSRIPEVLAKRRGVVGQEGVHQAEELHHSLVLPQVLVALQEENKLMPVAACEEWWEQLAQTGPGLTSSYRLCGPYPVTLPPNTKKRPGPHEKNGASFDGLPVQNEKWSQVKNKILKSSVSEDQEGLCTEMVTPDVPSQPTFRPSLVCLGPVKPDP